MALLAGLRRNAVTELGITDFAELVTAGKRRPVELSLSLTKASRHVSAENSRFCLK